MTRDINSATEAASQASAIHPVLFAKLEFDGGNVLFHSELGDITFGGDTYIGVGQFGGISSADEVSDLSNSPMNLTLSGIPSEVATILLAEQYQGRRATVFLGYLDLTTNMLVGDPAILFRGLIDTADIEQDNTFTITLSVGNRFSVWNTPLIRRYNNSDQQGRFPGDTGLEFVEQAASKEITWGGPL
jgi:hypothetical protein